MTREEFIVIIKPIWLVEKESHREFLISSLVQNFEKWLQSPDKIKLPLDVEI